MSGAHSSMEGGEVRAKGYLKVWEAMGRGYLYGEPARHDAEEAEKGKEKEREEQRAGNPIREEAYFFIKCLYRLRKMYKLQGFNPDFTKKMFGPYILNKLSRCDGDIKEAVNLWCKGPAAAEKKYGHISKWDVSHVTNMSELFAGHSKMTFDEDIGAWDVSKVTTMKGMFYRAKAFNQRIGNWDVSKVENMDSMFSEASTFNQPVGAWDVSKAITMEGMFHSASEFNQPIGDWDVSKVKGMSWMFYSASKFNQPLGGWDVSKEANMWRMFDVCPIVPKHKPERGRDNV